MLSGLWFLLRRRRAVFRAVFLTCLLLGTVTVFLSGRASVVEATLEVSQPLEPFPALDDQFAALFGKYLERFRQTTELAAWLHERGLDVDSSYLQAHLEIQPEMRDGCRFFLRVFGPRPGFALLLCETLVEWHLRESARLLQDHVREMQKFQEIRLDAVRTEAVRVRGQLAHLHASLAVTSLPEALKQTETRLARLQESLKTLEGSRRKLLEQLGSARRAAAASAAASRKRKGGRGFRAGQTAQSRVRDLTDRLLKLEKNKIATKGAILRASKVRLLLLEKKGEHEELISQEKALAAAAAMWTRKREFSILQQRTGIGRLSLSAGPRLIDEGFSLFRAEPWAFLLGLALVLGLAGAIVADSLDSTVRSPFFLPHIKAFHLLGKITDIGAFEETDREDPDEDRFPGDPLIMQIASDPSMLELRDQILTSLDRKPFETLLVLAPSAGGGVSSTVAGLGLALARKGLRILLVDADLQEPVLHRRFFLPRAPGLSTWRPGRPVEECCRPTGFPGLQLVSAGLQPPDPERFWSSADRIREFLAAAKGVADLVLLDTTPLATGQDARLFLPYADRVLVLAGVGWTQVKDVHQTFSFLTEGNWEPAGIVYNRIPPGEIDFLWRMI